MMQRKMISYVKSMIGLDKVLYAPLYQLFLLLVLVGISTVSKAEKLEINDIFIEASGNNIHEAKIKANELGMWRSLLLLADKLKLPTDYIKQVPYAKLKSVFSVTEVENEVSLVDRYNATVTYAYDKGKLFSMILEYGGEQINDKFYEYIIIPVFKQRNTMNIWEEDKRWNSIWNDSRRQFENHKIYLPKKNLFLSEKINEQTVLHLDLNDFIKIFNNVIFKNVMVVTAEFFTDRTNYRSIMKVKKFVFKPNLPKPEVIEEEYELKSLDEIPSTVRTFVDKTLNQYGVLRQSIIEEEKKKVVKNIIDEPKPIIMNFDVFNKEELEIVSEKLKRVPQVDRFTVTHDYGSKYKIAIYTHADEYELAEGLYLSGLSYKIHGDLYNLIDVKKGG